MNSLLLPETIILGERVPLEPRLEQFDELAVALGWQVLQSVDGPVIEEALVRSRMYPVPGAAVADHFAARARTLEVDSVYAYFVPALKPSRYDSALPDTAKTFLAVAGNRSQDKYYSRNVTVCARQSRDGGVIYATKDISMGPMGYIHEIEESVIRKVQRRQ